MEKTENHWTLGETATLTRKERLLKQSGTKSYSRFIGSRYICIREATDKQRGILMKVLGKVYSDKMTTVNGEAFSKDERDDLFTSMRYFSYSFPTASEVMEALGILRENKDLLQKFEEASMHVNPNSTFWVSDTTRNMLLQRKLQYLNGSDGQIYPDHDDAVHYRVTFVYFFKGSLNW